MRVLVTGAYGQVGSAIRYLTELESDIEFVFTGSDDLDICDYNGLISFFKRVQPDFCINCAAYTDAEVAEVDFVSCYKTNTVGSRNLAKVCREYSCYLFHFSSDYVYHLNKGTPILESDVPQPRSIYAQAKLSGDEYILSMNPYSMVLRVSWVCSVYKKNFMKTMLHLGQKRSELNVVADQTGTPTFAIDLGVSILHIIKNYGTKIKQDLSYSGIYNYSNLGTTNWCEFAQTIMEYASIDCKVNPISSDEYQSNVNRPYWSVMSKDKFMSTFNTQIPHWKISLLRCVEKYLSEHSLSILAKVTN